LSKQVLECGTHARTRDWYAQRRARPRAKNWREAPLGVRRRETSKACIEYARRYEAARFRIALRPQQIRFDETPVATRITFHLLARDWKRESKFASSPNQMFLLPSYQRIIALGPSAIPLILQDLLREPNHWFWALAALSGENPVPANDSGDIQAMTRAWIEWGRKKRYLQDGQ
jgi:hypothetical protein